MFLLSEKNLINSEILANCIPTRTQIYLYIFQARFLSAECHKLGFEMTQLKPAVGFLL